MLHTDVRLKNSEICRRQIPIHTMVWYSVLRFYHHMFDSFYKDSPLQTFARSLEQFSTYKELVRSSRTQEELLDGLLLHSQQLLSPEKSYHRLLIGLWPLCGKVCAMFFNMTILTFAVIISGILGYWAQDRRSPVEIKSVKVENHIVAPGEFLKIKLTVDRNKDCALHREKIYLDGHRTLFSAPDDDFISSVGPLGRDVYGIAIPISTAASEGEGILRIYSSYYCNPLQKLMKWPIPVYLPEQTFKILGPAKPSVVVIPDSGK